MRQTCTLGGSCEPASRQGMSSGEPDFKQLGNEEFRKGAYLKAAALYTKGLKLDPGNAVLLRSVPAHAFAHASELALHFST